jgi:hypothetical protein
MATKRKATRKPAKGRTSKARPAKAKPARKAAASKRGDREVHYTDLRKVMLANALKRLK